MCDLGRHRAFTGARRPDQKNAARHFQVDRRLDHALRQSKGQCGVGSDLRKIGGLAHQSLTQAFGQAVAFHGLAQDGAQVTAGKGDQIVACDDVLSLSHETGP